MVDNSRSSDGEVEGLTEEYSELEVLSMVNVGLNSLSKLPPLPKLRKVGPLISAQAEEGTYTLSLPKLRKVGTLCPCPS